MSATRHVGVAELTEEVADSFALVRLVEEAASGTKGDGDGRMPEPDAGPPGAHRPASLASRSPWGHLGAGRSMTRTKLPAARVTRSSPPSTPALEPVPKTWSGITSPLP